MRRTVTIRDLHVAYEDRTALCALDLTIPPASTVAVIGPNGSGKSTLLKAMAGIAPLRGSPVDLGGASVALVLQATDVDRAVPITVRDTVAMGRYPSLGLFGRFRARDRRLVSEAMARLDISDLADRQLHDLSGGQRQRVLVAQGLAQEADLVLLDEPVTGLDVISRERVLDVVEAERTAGRSVVMTTHDLDDARRCDQVLLLATRPIAVGTPGEVLREECLHEAFGGRVTRTGDQLVLDDPHHQH